MFRKLTATAAALISSVVGLAAPANAAGTVIFAPSFRNVSGLVTNEYAYWNASNTDAVKDSDWDMTSGSLFSSLGATTGVGGSGKIDAKSVDARSARGTNSAVFRLNTKRTDFDNVNVRFRLNIAALTQTSFTPQVNWDGIHIWMHYQSQYKLYYASVSRRDGHVVIKKKCPGGPSNDGTYYELSDEVAGFPIAYNTWSYVSSTIKTNSDGTVSITVFRDDKPIVSVTDKGTGCAPITGPGSVGIRGDNASFRFYDFKVRTA